MMGENMDANQLNMYQSFFLALGEQNGGSPVGVGFEFGVGRGNGSDWLTSILQTIK